MCTSIRCAVNVRRGNKSTKLDCLQGEQCRRRNNNNKKIELNWRRWKKIRDINSGNSSSNSSTYTVYTHTDTAMNGECETGECMAIFIHLKTKNHIECISKGMKRCNIRNGGKIFSYKMTRKKKWNVLRTDYVQSWSCFYFILRFFVLFFTSTDPRTDRQINHRILVSNKLFISSNDVGDRSTQWLTSGTHTQKLI